MPEVGLALILIVGLALVFDYINGFHDNANAIATVVSTRVLSPSIAVTLAAALNFAGAMVATRVAKTIASDIVAAHMATEYVVMAAVVSATIWNLITWIYGIPSSSSHALIGGLVGAALMHGGLQVVGWQALSTKVLIPLVGSPLAGFVIGWTIMKAVSRLLADADTDLASSFFKRLQLVSSSLMAFSHGQNDAQKSMGIITLALVSHGALEKPDVPLWVMLSCAGAMALGTAAGGWRIIRTVGTRIVRLEPVHGFSAETAGAAVILAASHFGMPISTTHTITGSIFGVGASRRISAVRWNVARSVVTAWILTLPATIMMGAGLYYVLGLFVG